MKFFKKSVAVLLTLAMVIGIFAAVGVNTSAAEAGLWVGGVEMTNGTYLANGATTTRTTKPSGGYAYYKDGTLTLNNYSYEGKGYNYATQCALIYSNADLTIELVGDNTLIQTAEHSDSIRVEERLIINGTGSLTSSDNRYGIYASKWISIRSGTIVVNSKVAGIFCDGSDVLIRGGDVTVTGGTYGIYVEEENFTIEGGDVTVTGGTYGIYVGEKQITVKGGTATIEGSSQAFVGRFAYNSGLLHPLATFTKDGPLVNYHSEYKDEYKKLVVLPYIYVGGVKVIDGTYLANGATETTTTKPSGGYAYYKDGTLTLNNYSYEGKCILEDELHYDAISIIDSKGDLTIELVGSNTLIQTYEDSYANPAIHVGNDYSSSELKSLTIGGTGTLTANSVDFAIEVRGDMTVNSGTIVATGDKTGIVVDGKVTNNGGNITAIGGEYGGISSGCYLDTVGNIPGGVFVNSGKVTAVGPEYAIDYDLGYNSEFRDSEFIIVADGMKIWASTTVNGALGEYVAANLDSYKKIVIESPAINTVNVSATWSGTPANATTSTTGATVTATKWYKKNGSSWTQLGASDTIKEGNTYRCEVTVVAEDSYYLADGYTVKINGIAATKKSGNTWYRDVTITGYSDYVDVDEIGVPEAYTNPVFTYDTSDVAPSRKHWDVVQVEWVECDKDGKVLSDALTENDVFKKDTYYRVEVTVVPKTNWQFHGSDLDFYINGKAANYLYGYNKAYADSVTGYLVYNTADIEGTYTLYVYDNSLTGSAKDILIEDGQYLGSDATAPTTTQPASGGYAYYKNGVLTLNGYDNEKAHFYFEELALELYLVGDNTIGAIYDNQWGHASNLEVRQGNLVIDAADGGKLTIASNPLDAYANIQVKDLYFNGGELTSCLANDTYGAAMALNDGNLYLENGYEAYVSDTNDFASATKWDGTTDISDYDCVWIVEEQATVTHTVTFNSLGGTTIAPQTVKHGEKAVKPADPKAAVDSLVFDKWIELYSNAEYNFDTPVTKDITLVAQYKQAEGGETPTEYNITVTGGTASVNKAVAGTSITLTANAAPAGKVFDKWVVTGATVADATKATTTFTMPAANVTAKATYKDKSVTPPDEPALRRVTVVNGTTSSEYSAEGTTVYLTANQIDGKVFSHWEVNGATVSDANAKETTFTMGNADVTAEAIYDDCECKCHKGGIVGFFYKIVLFFQKLFGNNLVCNCGKKH